MTLWDPIDPEVLISFRRFAQKNNVARHEWTHRGENTGGPSTWYPSVYTVLVNVPGTSRQDGMTYLPSFVWRRGVPLAWVVPAARDPSAAVSRSVGVAVGALGLASTTCALQCPNEHNNQPPTCTWRGGFLKFWG